MADNSETEDSLALLMAALHPRRRPAMAADFKEEVQEVTSEEAKLALAVLELTECREWAVYQALLKAQLEFWNGELIRTLSPKAQGAYAGLMELWNVVAGLRERGKQIRSQDVSVKEDEENVS